MNRASMHIKSAVHWAWVVLAVCFVNLFVNYSVRLGYGVVLPEMIRELNFSRTAGGSIYNAYLFVYIALTPLTGLLTDRIGARPVIAVCSLILGVGVVLMGTVQGVGSACLFYAIVGLGATGMWTPVITVVQRWFDVKSGDWPWGSSPPATAWGSPPWVSSFPGSCSASTGGLPGIFWVPRPSHCFS